MNKKIYAIVTALVITTGGLAVAGSAINSENVSAETGAMVLSEAEKSEGLIYGEGDICKIDGDKIVIEIDGVEKEFTYEYANDFRYFDEVSFIYDGNTNVIKRMTHIELIGETTIVGNKVTEQAIVKAIDGKNFVVEILGQEMTFEYMYTDELKVGDIINLTYNDLSYVVYYVRIIGMVTETTDTQVTEVTADTDFTTTNETYPTETTTVPETPDFTEIADVNGDGKVNILDLMQFAQYIAGVEGTSGADVNGDGKANILDLMAIAQYIVGGEEVTTTTTEATDLMTTTKETTTEATDLMTTTKETTTEATDLMTTTETFVSVTDVTTAPFETTTTTWEDTNIHHDV